MQEPIVICCQCGKRSDRGMIQRCRACTQPTNKEMEKVMTEAAIEDYLTAYASKRGCLCLKLALVGQRGWPDRTLITPFGRVMCVEVKTPEGKLTKQQRRWIDRLKVRGVPVHVVRSNEDVIRVVNAFVSNSLEHTDS